MKKLAKGRFALGVNAQATAIVLVFILLALAAASMSGTFDYQFWLGSPRDNAR
jgi:hypothetical protein